MKVKLRSCDSFSEEELRHMLSIYQGSYKTTWEEFLQKKSTIDLYATYLHNGKMIGFTGLRYRKIRVDKKNYRAMYIGHTIIPAEYRGKSLIQKTVIRMFIKHLFTHPFTTLLAWNNSVTYRPYLIMAKGLKNYYPKMGASPSNHRKKIQDTLGEIYYGKSYDAATGVVTRDVNVMEPHEVNYTEKELSDPHIRYYLSCNPWSAQGQGLITFSFGTLGNLFYYLMKRLRRKYAKKS